MNRVFIEKSGLPTGTYYLVGLLLIPILGLFLWGLYQQIVMGEAFGNTPTNDNTLIGLAIGVFIICGGMFWVMSIMQAEIRLADNKLAYRFRPFVNKEKVFDLSEIAQWAVIKRSFISTGIGLRYDPRKKSKIYSIGSEHFLAIEFKSGKRIMISTRKPDELKRSIKAMQSREYE
jgi:hypothetical protein